MKSCYLITSVYIYINIWKCLVTSKDTGVYVMVDRIHSQRSAAKQLRDRNDEDLPLECRTDFCHSHTTSDLVKGTLMWPQIQVGYELEQYCQWTQFDKVKVRRHCVMEPNGTLVWTPLDVDQCPDPPIKYQLVKLIDEKPTADEVNTDFLAEKLRVLYNTYHDYHETTPYDLDDRKLTLEFLIEIGSAYEESDTSMETETIKEYFYILDILLTNPYELSLVFRFDPKLAQSLLIQLHSIPNLLNDSNIERSFTLSSSNIYFHSQMISGNSDSDGLFTMDIGNNLSKNKTSYYVDRYSIEMAKQDHSGSQRLSVLVVNHIGLFNNVMAFKGIVQKNKNTFTEPVRNKKHGNRTNIPLPDSRPEGFTGTINPTAYTISSTSGSSSQEETYKVPWGPLIILTTEKGTKVNITYRIKNIDSPLAKCATTETDDLSIWTGRTCTSTLNDNTLICQCQHAVAYGSFSNSEFFGKRASTKKPMIVKPIGGIDLFLGFPYNKELYIIGKVGNALSVCGLVATVLCYATIRKARRGLPTWILIHLCVSLILLISFTFTLEIFAHNKVGCSVANAFRYYLVFVSLFWNGIEGFNMYQMLVRVFNIRIPHFRLKATLIAWGIPMLMIVICTAVNHKAFNGQYVLLSVDEDGKGTCSFRCQLRTTTLLYGFVLPMMLVIIHNIVVFCLVLRVLTKLGKEGAIKSTKKRSRLAELIGALSTLVLLGVPWIFSAFGVVDADTNKHLTRLEVIIQVIFVICVSLQGLFIFLFHCGRNADIRAHWKAILKISGNSSVTVSSSLRTASTNDRVMQETTKL